jgi:hypothetical protein
MALHLNSFAAAEKTVNRNKSLQKSVQLHSKLSKFSNFKANLAYIYQQRHEESKPTIPMTMRRIQYANSDLQERQPDDNENG